MALEAKLPAEGKFTFLDTNKAHIVSKKQYDHPVLDEAKAIANTYAQTGYGLNGLQRNITRGRLDDFTRDHLITHDSGFLRNGYINRGYGRIIPKIKAEFPKPGDPITPIASEHITMFDDLTGQKLIKLFASVDYDQARGSSAFLDIYDYAQYVQEHALKVGESLSRPLSVISGAYCMASFPAATLTTDVDLVPFLDSSLRPDATSSKNANAGFDTEGEFGKDIIKKEVIGQVQEKFTNIGYYSPELYVPMITSVEFEAKSKPTVTANDTTTPKIYFMKDNSKQKTHKELNRHICLVALAQHIRNKIVSMTSINTPMNMGFYKPYEAAAQTEYQLSTTVPADWLEIILNPYDKAEFALNISMTSPYGNYNASLDDIKAMGVSVYARDTVLPGCATIQEKRTFSIIEVLNQNYQMNFEFILGKQYGGHLGIKVYMNKFTCRYHCVPTHFVPAQEYLTHHFKALEVS